MNTKKVLHFLKNNVVYVAFSGITFIACVAFAIWSGLAAGGSTVEIVRAAKAVIAETTVTEYLAGEKLNTDGVTLVLEDGRVITDAAYTAEADLTTAGTKAVSVVYEENGEKHVGKYAVEVFAVRHFDLRNYPKVLIKSSRGFTFDGFTLWAELSGTPVTNRFSTTPDHPEWKNTVIIANDMYDISFEDNDSGSVYTANVKVGIRNLSFDFYGATAGFDASKVASAVSMMEFTDKTENSEYQLTLFVNKKETDPNDGTDGASGYYVLKRTVGDSVTYNYYRFSYYIDGGWASHFTSEEFNEGISESFVLSSGSYPYTVRINIDGDSLEFEGNGEAWRAAFVAV